MANNKIIQQPDILNLDSLGAFMDAQNDPIASVTSEDVASKSENIASDTGSEDSVPGNNQNEVLGTGSKEVAPKKARSTRARKAKQTVQPVIEAGSGEWDTMVRYAAYYNENPDEDRITVVLNPEIKRALDIIRINCRQFNFGNILNAVCRTFIERNKEQILRLQKDKGGIL